MTAQHVAVAAVGVLLAVLIVAGLWKVIDFDNRCRDQGGAPYRGLCIRDGKVIDQQGVRS